MLKIKRGKQGKLSLWSEVYCPSDTSGGANQKNTILLKLATQWSGGVINYSLSKYSSSVWCQYDYFTAPYQVKDSLILSFSYQTYDIYKCTSSCLWWRLHIANETPTKKEEPTKEALATRCYVFLQCAPFSAPIPPSHPGSNSHFFTFFYF